MVDMYKRRIMWLSEWHVFEQELWFAHMAAAGWKLVSIGKVFATFKQGAPKNINYRCDIFDLDHPGHHNQVKRYEEAGWKHVASRKYIQIFEETTGASSTEIPVGSAVQKQTAEILTKEVRKKFRLTLLSSVLLVLLQFLMLQNDPVGNYLNDGFLFFAITAMILLLSIIRGFTQMIQMNRLIKKIKNDRFYSDGAHFELKMHQRKLIGLGMAVFATSVIFFTVASIFVRDVNTQIPADKLQVVVLSDTIPNDTYEQIQAISGNDTFYYTEKSSLLVPQQYQLIQSFDIVLQDNNQTFSPNTLSHRYEARSQWLAKHLLQRLNREASDGLRSFQPIDDDRFDELWLREINENVEILVRNEHVIHSFSYYSNQSIDGMIENTLTKIAQLLAEGT